MALTTTTNKVIHSGNASATVFSYAFPILDAAHLTVIYTDADDAGDHAVAQPVQCDRHRSRRRAAASPIAWSGAPIATGTKLTIVRTVPYTQTTVLSNQGGYYPEVVEAPLRPDLHGDAAARRDRRAAPPSPASATRRPNRATTR